MKNLQSEAVEAFRSIEIPENKAIKAAAALARRDDDVIGLRSAMPLVTWMAGVLLPCRSLSCSGGLFSQRAAAVGERAEGFFGRRGLHEFVEVIRSLALARGFDLE